MPSSKKLYIVTRQDLAPGIQAAQAAHAITELIFEHPSLAHDWYTNSNFIVILSVPKEEDLYDLSSKLKTLPVKWSQFREPDINHEITAVAILPNNHTGKLLSHLPLALKEKKNDK